jgi:tetratricopeptide (TPR) repeat protein
MTTQSYLFNEQKQYDKALEFALKAKAFWPERWQPHVNIGHAMIGLGKLDEAEAAYTSTIAYNPTWPIVYDEVASFFIQRDKREMAEQVYHKGLVKFPEQPDLLLHYGQFLLAANRKEQALNYLSKAYRATPDDVTVWAALLPLSANTKDPVLLEVRQKATVHINTKPDTPTAQQLNTLLRAQ